MALRNGETYRESLRDGREVYVEGKRVDDVTTHPDLAPVVDTVARLFDLQHQPEYRDLLTWEGDDGERCGGAWMKPRNKAQGIWRRRFAQLQDREVGGMFGRLPDISGAGMLGVLDIRQAFSGGRRDYRENIERFVDYATKHDLSMGHAFVTEQADASKSIDETDVPRIIRQTADGIVVSGVWTLGTFTPYANEVLLGTYPRAEQRDEHIMYFVAPVNSPGLRVVARPVWGQLDPVEHPLGRFGDENDSMLIFDNVFVPQERIFSVGDPTFAIRVFPKISEWVHWSILYRLEVKAEILVGLIALLPEVLGRAATPFSMEAVGESLRYLTTIRAFLYAAEERGHITESGYWAPDRIFVTAGRAYAVEHYRRILGYIQDLGGQGLINVPSQAAMDNEVIGPTLHHLFSTSAASAEERMRIYRMAFELSSSSTGGRQTMFELFNALPWSATRQQLLKNTDLDPFKNLVRGVAGLLDPAATREAAMRVAAEGMSGDEKEMYERVGRVILEYKGMEYKDTVAQVRE